MKRIPVICVLVLVLALLSSEAWADRYEVRSRNRTRLTLQTVLVRPVGTPVQSGSVLLNTLNNITDASSEKPYVLKIEPGVYDLGTTSLEMKEYVDIEGSGEIATKITGSAGDSPFSGVVMGASNAELRFLTVESTGGGSYAIAIYNFNASPKITNVTANAFWGSDTNIGVKNEHASPTMTNVTAKASGGPESDFNPGIDNGDQSSPIMANVNAIGSGGRNSYGVHNANSSSPTMTNVIAKASSASHWNTGVDNAGYCFTTMIDVTAIASGSGAVHNHGVRNGQNSSPIMTNVVATASGGEHNWGVFNLQSSSPTMNNVTATGSGGERAFGVSNEENCSPIMTNVIANAFDAWKRNDGVYNHKSSPVMTNVTATASGGESSVGVKVGEDSSAIMTNVTATASGLGNNFGLQTDDYVSATADRCTFKGDPSIGNCPGATLYIGTSKLDGGIVHMGTYICVGCYDADYQPLGNDCRHPE
jgi:hypothetical protein